MWNKKIGLDLGMELLIYIRTETQDPYEVRGTYDSFIACTTFVGIGRNLRMTQMCIGFEWLAGICRLASETTADANIRSESNWN
jgi:hypothetical protein